MEHEYLQSAKSSWGNLQKYQGPFMGLFFNSFSNLTKLDWMPNSLFYIYFKYNLKGQF